MTNKMRFNNIERRRLHTKYVLTPGETNKRDNSRCFCLGFVKTELLSHIVVINQHTPSPPPGSLQAGETCGALCCGQTYIHWSTCSRSSQRKKKLRRCLGPNPDTHMCGCVKREELKTKQKRRVQEQSLKAQRKRCSLFVEGTAAAGGGAIFKEGVREVPVQVVRHRPRDSLPRQDEDHQHGRVTVVPWSLADQTQQLLLLTAAPDHLSHDCVHTENKCADDWQMNDNIATQTNTAKYFFKQHHKYPAELESISLISQATGPW